MLLSKQLEFLTLNSENYIASYTLATNIRHTRVYIIEIQVWGLAPTLDKTHENRDVTQNFG